jgi:hypothetical protein
MSSYKSSAKVVTKPDPDLEKWCAVLSAGSAVAEFVPPGWFTIQQLARARGRSDCSTTIVIKRLIESGRAERKLFTIKLAQLTRPVPHYRLK